MRALRATYVALAISATASIGHAEPCETDQPEAGAPVRTQLGPADFGTVPEACGANEISARGRMGVLIAEDDFYGRLHLAGAIGGRLLLPGGSWLSAQLPGVEYRFIANATVEATSVDLSASTLGWHVPLLLAERLQIAPYLRTMLPTETVFRNGRRYGFEQGISLVADLAPALEIMGGYALPLLLTTTAGQTHSVFMPTMSLDAGLRPWSWAEGVVGASVRLVPGDAEALESIDPRVALRFYPWHQVLIDVSGSFPLSGRDRTLVAAGLTLGWLFGANEVTAPTTTPIIPTPPAMKAKVRMVSPLSSPKYTGL